MPMESWQMATVALLSLLHPKKKKTKRTKMKSKYSSPLTFFFWGGGHESYIILDLSLTLPSLDPTIHWLLVLSLSLAHQHNLPVTMGQTICPNVHWRFCCLKLRIKLIKYSLGQSQKLIILSMIVKIKNTETSVLFVNQRLVINHVFLSFYFWLFSAAHFWSAETNESISCPKLF